MSTTVAKLIRESAQYTKIAHADYSAELAEALDTECENCVVNGRVHEFWGTSEEGNEWRVHLTEEAPAIASDAEPRRYGYSFSEWLKTAGRSDSASEYDLRAAWKAGEDPKEYAGDKAVVV